MGSSAASAPPARECARATGNRPRKYVIIFKNMSTKPCVGRRPEMGRRCILAALFSRRGGRVGRRQPPAKRLQGQKLCPGFESLPLRQTAPLAQVDRASDYESEGQRFESSRAHHPLQGLT